MNNNPSTIKPVSKPMDVSLIDALMSTHAERGWHGGPLQKSAQEIGAYIVQHEGEIIKKLSAMPAAYATPRNPYPIMRVALDQLHGTLSRYHTRNNDRNLASVGWCFYDHHGLFMEALKAQEKTKSQFSMER